MTKRQPRPQEINSEWNYTEQLLPNDRDNLRSKPRPYNENPYGLLSNGFNTVILVAVGVAAVFVAIYIYMWVMSYKLAKDTRAVFNIINPKPRVGQTITCQTRFKKKTGGLIPYSSGLFSNLQKHCQIIVIGKNLKHSVAVCHSASAVNSHITGKFSLRLAGIYELTVKYQGVSLAEDERFSFEVWPELPSHKTIDFGTHNPRVLCCTASSQKYFKIQVQDRYGNQCKVDELPLEKFSFELYDTSHRAPGKYEFCYHAVDPLEESPNADSICLKVKIDEPGVYHCVLKYEDRAVQGDLIAQRIFICMSSNEEEDVQKRYSLLRFPGTAIYNTPCKMSLLEDCDKFADFHVGVTPNDLVLASYKVASLLLPCAKFPINGKTKIIFHQSRYATNETEGLAFIVQDGLRPSVVIDLEPTSSRMLLVTFAHNQGFVLPRLGESFQEKRHELKGQLSHSFLKFWFTSEMVLEIEQGDLIESTLKAVPTDQDSWLLPFSIQYKSQVPMPQPITLSATSWLNQLCEEFFMRNGENGLFQRFPDSKLIHPVSATISHKSLEVYKLAGKILGKAIVEALLRALCTNMNNVRFTTSFLAFVLGHPMHFKFLEMDDPRYFRKIKPILESDMTDKDYTFTTLPTSSSDSKVVNLIREGSITPVTNENKEYYLNLLTYDKMIHPVEQEMKAFRNGLYEVIDKDNFCNFNEEDLQKSISGGCKFSIKDMKHNHRIIKEEDNGLISSITRRQIDSKKVIDWFWLAIENMTELEHSYLVHFTTGSFSLPSCGMAALNPPFTINLTGTLNDLPKGRPYSNEIVLGDHVSFDSFEQTLLYAINPESERLAMGEQLQMGPFAASESMEFREDENGTGDDNDDGHEGNGDTWEAGEPQQGSLWDSIVGLAEGLNNMLNS